MSRYRYDYLVMSKDDCDTDNDDKLKCKMFDEFQ